MSKKIALVTGGGSGLGKAIAAAFIAQGITTIICGRQADKLAVAAAELGPLAIPQVADVTELAALPALVQQLEQTVGPIEILVNNAGINMKKPLTEVSDADFQQILTTNVCAVFALSREVAKGMIERNSGCIIHISSMAAQYGLPKVIAYSAAKSAIDGMTRAMAVELSPLGIRVNAIAPGFIYSDMTAKALDSDPERKARVFARTPMGRMGQPEDIGAAAAYLASDAARFVTGVVLRIDGGNAIGF
ncbi:MAG: SDR family oxidoreductase [Chitinophagaceae bacterium]|nr:SDR family oxidoreductase [Chitinophagaceae bacterium]